MNHSTPSLVSSPLIPDFSDPLDRPFSAANFAPEAVVQSEISVGAEVGMPRDVPEVECDRCAKPKIQHDLHYHCSKCNGGQFDLCLDCYRAGRGCNHWFGFGYAAWTRYKRAEPAEGYPADHDQPHILLARKYPRSNTPAQRVQPSRHLEEGAFCERCFSFTDASYWHCYICLEGAWGYCASCLNKGHHCTHPLLPVGHYTTTTENDQPAMRRIPMPHLPDNTYVSLPIRQDCDICHYPIAPTNTRFHCNTCNEGDYDVCNECYYGLVASGKIPQANGPNGWRRCLQNHRMSVVGFQDTPEGGQQRVVVRELVGGWALKDDGAPQEIMPPDGGVGLRCLTLWNRFVPEEDELAFPKNAEIREAEQVNEDWFWGVYAGQKGLFPGNHVRVL
jgi:Zn finger protein HypA/HybF involved in hydrogenase expression